jgi:beta-glucosidase/6-phospho-beta-glucosidase/beta-galactosidase
MELLRSSSLGRTLDAGAFFWAAGIEDTFITHPWAGTGRALDEYELTEHYARWHEDMGLFAELGVPVVRYGIPWHRINPAPGIWDWSFPDKALNRLLELGIEPVVDLVHYGLPAWIEGAYLNPDFPQFMAEYARRAAERYKGRIHCYTPLNEPRVTGWYCGKLGWWPPAQRGWRGFVRVMSGVCAGIVETVHALREVDPDILCAHVDATDLYESSDPSLAEEVARRQEIVFLALDLISGRIVPGHSLHGWLQKWGMDPARLEWFQQRKIDLQLIGINLYPLFSRKVLKKSSRGLRISMPYASAEIIDRLAELYWQRYRVPIFISETASEGSVRRRMEWLDSSVAATGRVRSRGIPLIGYTWWPLFALVTWGYRQGHHPPEFYLKQMGLWDLQKSAKGLERVPTPLVQAYKQLAARGPRAFEKIRIAA